MIYKKQVKTDTIKEVDLDMDSKFSDAGLEDHPQALAVQKF